MDSKKTSELLDFTEEHAGENTLTLITHIGFEDDSKDTKSSSSESFPVTKEIDSSELD